jgi:hypothetical protein
VVVSAFAREDIDKKGMDLAQVTGSVSSYARKYALNGLFCIDDTKDADTTNQHGKEKTQPLSTPASRTPRNAPEGMPLGNYDTPPPRSTPRPQAAPPPPVKDAITEPQRKRLFAICNAHNVPDDVVKAKIKEQGFTSSKDLTKKAYDIVVAFAESWVDNDGFVMPDEG